MTGRPTVRTEAIIESILDQHGDGVPLMQICRQEGMPSLRTVYDWLDSDADLAARFARARRAAMDNVAQETLDIADERTGKAIMADGAEVAVVFDSTAVQRNRLRVDTRLKLLSCWDSGRYGTKHQHEHTGKVTLESLVAGHEPEAE